MEAGSVAGGSVGMGSPEGAVAAGAQEEIIIPRIKTNMILRIIPTHFQRSAADYLQQSFHLRIHAGQQMDSALSDHIFPVTMSALCTIILPFLTTLKVKVFPPGAQNGVPTRPSVIFVI